MGFAILMNTHNNIYQSTLGWELVIYLAIISSGVKVYTLIIQTESHGHTL